MVAPPSSTWSASMSLSRLLVPLSEHVHLDHDDPTGAFVRATPPRISLVPGMRIRGAAIRAFVQWYEVELGTPRFRSLLQRMPASVAGHFDLAAEGLGILATSWYACALVEGLLDALTGHLSDHRRGHVALRAARVVMRSTLGGPYQRIFATLATPERYAERAQTLWNAYYDSGFMRVAPRSDVPGATCGIRHWRAHHPLLCGLNAGASTAIYEAMGKRQVSTMRVACVSLGHDECVFSTTWRD